MEELQRVLIILVIINGGNDPMPTSAVPASPSMMLSVMVFRAPMRSLRKATFSILMSPRLWTDILEIRLVCIVLGQSLKKPKK